MSEPAPLLAALRPDLHIRPGPTAADGSPSYVLHDPLEHTYDHVSWQGMAILERLSRPRDLDDLAAELARDTPVRLSREEIRQFCQDLQDKGLTCCSLIRPVAALEAEAAGRVQHPLRWLLHHYLYFRIPVIRPDAFLGRTVSSLRFLGSAPFLILYGVVLLAGLGMLSLRFEEYLHTFPYYLTGSGLAWYAAVVTGLKIVHEFAHAYTAKALGVRVPVMGVAFLVLWPVAYCDVSDAWSLPDRKKRLAIALAGITTEMAVAGASLFLWAVSPPGLAQSLFFVLSSGSLASTLLINLNPAMSFDGYYILMDLCGIDNLRPRAFAVTLWLWRRTFCGLDDPPPEEGLSRTRLWGMAGYAVFTFAYRLALYVTIAVFVYLSFTKVLGVALFAVEVWWFILRPFIQEARALFALRSRLKLNRRLAATLATGLALLAWAALPVQQSFRVPAIVTSRSTQTIYAPHPGRIERIAAGPGQTVEAGDILADIAVPALLGRLEHWRYERMILEKQSSVMALAEEDKVLLPQKREEMRFVEAHISSITGQLAQNELRADIPGVLAEWDETLRPGDYVGKNQALGRIIDPQSLQIQAFVGELDIASLLPEHEATFFLARGGPVGRVRIREISPLRTESMEHAALTTLGQGTLPATQDRKGRMVLVESHYRIEADLLPGHGEVLPGQTGTLTLTSTPRSRLGDMIRQVYRVIMREAHPG